MQFIFVTVRFLLRLHTRFPSLLICDVCVCVVCVRAWCGREGSNTDTCEDDSQETTRVRDVCVTMMRCVRMMHLCVRCVRMIHVGCVMLDDTRVCADDEQCVRMIHVRMMHVVG